VAAQKSVSRSRRHVPQRTCIGCRQVLNKRSLIRLVRSPDGEVRIDLTGKMPGRGAYLHDQQSCWQAALKGSLARALRTELSPQAQETLALFLQTLDG
jgi:uncharacterized protein